MVLKRHKIDVLGVEVDDISEEKAISGILALALDRKNFHQIVTVNAEMVMMARRNPEFAKILRNSDLAVCDGQWLVWAKLIMGGNERDRITGVDLVKNLCELSAEKAITVGFLGGFDGVANDVFKRQKLVTPGLKLAYAGPDFETISREMRLEEELVGKIRADILFVAYGMGRQEFWIWENRKTVNFGVAIGVGGAFDYLAGVKKRAPKFLQKSGMEWFWRLLAEPSRLWRMRVLPIFLVLVLANLVKNYFIKFQKS